MPERSPGPSDTPASADAPLDVPPDVPPEGGGGIVCVRGDGAGAEPHRGWNGIRYRTGLSAHNVGARELSMNVATIPPGGVAYAHVHEGFEVMLYIVRGRVKHAYGEGLERELVNEGGDFVFIEPGVPHEVYNLSDEEEVVAVVARSDASEWAHIVDYPSPTRPGGDR